jgi:superoxide reductase
MKFADVVKTADWKAEKHVPVIDCPDQVKADEIFEVKVSIGKEVAHPNTTEHHISWIHVWFQPDGGKFVHQVAAVEFSAHGESTEGPNAGPVYTHHGATVQMKINKPGTILAGSLCNIHGLWENSKAIKVS